MLYDKLKLHKEVIKELTDLGIVPVTIVRNIEIFEFYSSLNSELGTYTRYEITAEKFNLSSDTIKTIILKLNK